MAEGSSKPAEQTAEAAAPAPVTRPKEVIINLETAVQAHGETVKQLKFRRPTGGDLMAMTDGSPIIINRETGDVTPNGPVMGNMMSLLAAVPPSTIKALDAEDWTTCAYALASFFIPGAQARQYF